MAIEIKELNVRLHVGQTDKHTPSATTPKGPKEAAEPLPVSRKLIQSLAAEVWQLLKKRKER